MAHSCIPLALGLVFSQLGTTLTSDLPHFRAENGAQQFVVHGKPFLILGGELGNSSAGTAAQADLFLPDMARMHTDNRIAGIASIEQVSKAGSEWVVSARLDGDQSNQGRQLTMAPREIRTYRPRLYSASR